MKDFLYPYLNVGPVKSYFNRTLGVLTQGQMVWGHFYQLTYSQIRVVFLHTCMGIECGLEFLRGLGSNRIKYLLMCLAPGRVTNAQALWLAQLVQRHGLGCFQNSYFSSSLTKVSGEKGKQGTRCQWRGWRGGEVQKQQSALPELVLPLMVATQPLSSYTFILGRGCIALQRFSYGTGLCYLK